MSPRFPFLSALAGLALLGGATAGVLLFRGSGSEALRGAALGTGAGAGGALLEAVLVYRALSMPRGDALRVVLAGFGIRLALLVTGVLLLHRIGFADPVAFGLAFVGGFLAGIPVVVGAVLRRPSAGGSR